MAFEINIGGVSRFTTVDFPEKLACVLFTQGCVWDCSFCHNKHLQEFSCKENPKIPWSDVRNFLRARKKMLDGVVFSGGEPLMQPNLKQAIEEVKDIGYKVALHTGGYNPKKLKEVLLLCDWVGMDFKSKLNKYEKTTRAKVNIKNIEESLETLVNSGKDFEIRTTLDPRIISPKELLEITNYLEEKGVKNYAIQEYRPTDGEGEPTLNEIKSFFLDKKLLEEIEKKFEKFTVRK